MIDYISLDPNIYAEWINGYFSQIIRLILVFNYFFPEGNFRAYLDHYMLEHFESFNDGRFNLVDTLYDSNYTNFKKYYKIKSY